jgi:hypothetical protein
MADCECLAGCPFFGDRMANMPAIAESFKRRYCRGDNASCARYKVFKALGRERVPADLFPNEGDRAEKLIAQG